MRKYQKLEKKKKKKGKEFQRVVSDGEEMSE